VREGFRLKFGAGQIRVLETPGHTPESICLLIFDPERSADNPWAVLTGDTLFIGDVGRPDLSDAYTPQQLAGLLFDSLHRKLLPLPDGVLVYPAHGAGSLCGRNLRDQRYSTIGTERLTNPALQIKDRGQFVLGMTSKLPPRPQYFAQDAALNREGAAALDQLPPLPAWSAAEVGRLRDRGTVVLDTRPAAAFADGHVPGSVNIGLTGQFASWAGTVIGLSTPIVLVDDTPERIAEARMRLARVGIENVVGSLDGGVRGFQDAGFELARMPQVTVRELRDRLDQFRVLDVRRGPEWQAAHIEGAIWHPLDDFPRELPPLPKDAPIALHCRSGYRSMLAASLLRRAGYQNVTNVVGGFDAWQAESLPAAA